MVSNGINIGCIRTYNLMFLPNYLLWHTTNAYFNTRSAPLGFFLQTTLGCFTTPSSFLMAWYATERTGNVCYKCTG